MCSITTRKVSSRSKKASVLHCANNPEGRGRSLCGCFSSVVGNCPIYYKCCPASSSINRLFFMGWLMSAVFGFMEESCQTMNICTRTFTVRPVCLLCIFFRTSNLHSWSTGFLGSGTVLAHRPRDQLASPPLVGFPPTKRTSHTMVSWRPVCLRPCSPQKATPWCMNTESVERWNSPPISSAMDHGSNHHHCCSLPTVEKFSADVGSGCSYPTEAV